MSAINGRFYIHHFCNRAVDLQAIAVDDPDEIIEPVMACGHSGFPDLAFLQLAVAHDAECFVGLSVQLPRQRDSYRDAQSLPQRAGRDLDTLELEPVRMTLVWRAKLAQQYDVVVPGMGWEPCARRTR